MMKDTKILEQKELEILSDVVWGTIGAHSISAAEKLAALFTQNEVVVPKKTKNGIQDQNIITMIRKLNIQRVGEQELVINTLICCQNPTLNPAQIPLAIQMYVPELAPEHCVCSRVEVYDINEKIFR